MTTLISIWQYEVFGCRDGRHLISRDYIYLPVLRGVDKQGYLGLYKALGACLKKQRLSAAAWWERLIKDTCAYETGLFLIVPGYQ